MGGGRCEKPKKRIWLHIIEKARLMLFILMAVKNDNDTKGFWKYYLKQIGGI
jgi:hypothetical protein